MSGKIYNADNLLASSNFPTGKRERVHRYYSRVLSMCLSALYDGQPKNFPGRDYIEYVISAIGYDQADEWAYITDEDLIKTNIVGLRIRDDVAIARETERIQKQRARLNEWQAKAGNPIIIEFECEYDKDEKKNRAKYKRPICELIREIVADCPVGTPDKRLRVTVAIRANEYLKRFDGTAKTVKGKREHSADSDANRAATFALEAYRKQENKSGQADAVVLIRNAFRAKFGDLYTQVFATYVENAENEKSDVANKGVNPESCSKPVGGVNTLKMDGLWCDKNIIPGPQFGPPSPPVIVGQSVEDFLSENFPQPPRTGTDNGPVNWRGLPVTDKQRELIIRAGGIVPATRGEASDKIDELIKSGELTDFYSLAELESYDPKAGGRHKTERRFCCPSLGCGDSKPMDDEHRSLCVNTYSGKYNCKRCGDKGILRERICLNSTDTRTFTHTAPPTEPKSEKWKEWVEDAKPIEGTAGAAYLEGRGVPVDVAQAAGVRYGRWFHNREPFNAVIFPIHDINGNVIAAQARAIDGDIKNTRGPRSGGVFLATPDAFDSARVAICEAPIDALILQACGIDAIALGGTAIQEWLPGALEGKDVAIATDADEAGDECAARLASLLPTSWRLRPVGAKDWGELAELGGLDAVDECVMDAMERVQ